MAKSMKSVVFNGMRLVEGQPVKFTHVDIPVPPMDGTLEWDAWECAMKFMPHHRYGNALYRHGFEIASGFDLDGGTVMPV